MKKHTASEHRGGFFIFKKVLQYIHMFFTRSNFYIFAIMICVVVGMTTITPTAHAASFVVDSNLDTTDSNYGDGICDDGDGNCTLRSAIIEADATPELDSITFNSPMTIVLSSSLPAFYTPITVDASSTGTCSADQGVVIDADETVNDVFSLREGADGSTIRGFIIHSYLDGAIDIESISGSETEISCNMIGLSPDGQFAAGGTAGITIVDSSDITIGGSLETDRNIISGNQVVSFGSGISISNNDTDPLYPTDDITIEGNWFGLDSAGEGVVLNGRDAEGTGVSYWQGSNGSNMLIRNNVFGIQSANIDFIDTLTIQGNTFGLSATGEILEVPFVDFESFSYIRIQEATNVLVGGEGDNLGNIFAGNGVLTGVRVSEVETATIINNFFGVRADGVTPILTDGFLDEVISAASSSDVVIGSPEYGNIILNNENEPTDISIFNGIDIVVQSNYLGITANLETFEALEPSGWGIIVIGTDNSTVTVGGESVEQGNRIGGRGFGIYAINFADPGSLRIQNNQITDGGTGIMITQTPGFAEEVNGPIVATLLQNRIYDATTAIDLARDIDGDFVSETNLGPTPNDPGDIDTGPNHYLNTPIIHSVDITGLTTYSVDVPAGDYRIEFFAGSGVNQATDYVGYDTFISTGSSKQQTITLDLSGLDNDDHISATTTEDLGSDTYGATSELSQEYVPLAQPKRRTVSGTVSPEYLAQQGIVLDQSSQPSTSSSTTSASCPADQILTQNMRAGARNGKYHPYTKAIVTEVKKLQVHMNRLGFNSGPVDGILGPITDGAIKRMQTFLGTKADGMIGPITRGLINHSCGGGGLKKGS